MHPLPAVPCFFFSLSPPLYAKYPQPWSTSPTAGTLRVRKKTKGGEDACAGRLKWRRPRAFALSGFLPSSSSTFFPPLGLAHRDSHGRPFRYSFVSWRLPSCPLTILSRCSVSLRSFRSAGDLLLPSPDKPSRALFGIFLFSPLPRGLMYGIVAALLRAWATFYNLVQPSWGSADLRRCSPSLHVLKILHNICIICFMHILLFILFYSTSYIYCANCFKFWN